MAKTGQPGGRQSLENNRVHGSIHAKPPEAQQVPQADIVANASVRHGAPNTNRIGHPERPPEVQKALPTSGRVSYPQGHATTNVTKRG